jgi:hypothetical protein
MIVGIDEMNTRMIRLFPNPADEFVRIRYPMPLNGKIKITLTTTDGRITRYYEVKPSARSNEYLMDIQDLAPGMYFITLYSENAYMLGKLVVR